MSFDLQPLCYAHCGKRAKPGRLFCSDRCAATFGEELARGNGDHWCPVCDDWKHPEIGSDVLLVCGHGRTDMLAGTSHADAKEKYSKAVERFSAESQRRAELSEEERSREDEMDQIARMGR